MSEFWQDLIVNLVSNAALGGVLVYLGKFYLERIGRNEQAIIDVRLKKLEQSHEKLINKEEHFHQISQEAYRQLYERRINVYDKLYNSAIQLRISLPIVPSSLSNKVLSLTSLTCDERNQVQFYSNYYLIYEELITEIMQNISVVSKNLASLYAIWIVKLKPKIVQTDPKLINHSNKKLPAIIFDISTRMLSEMNPKDSSITKLLDDEELDRVALIHLMNLIEIERNLDYLIPLLQQIQDDVIHLNEKIDSIF